MLQRHCIWCHTTSYNHVKQHRHHRKSCREMLVKKSKNRRIIQGMPVKPSGNKQILLKLHIELVENDNIICSNTEALDRNIWKLLEAEYSEVEAILALMKMPTMISPIRDESESLSTSIDSAQPLLNQFKQLNRKILLKRPTPPTHVNHSMACSSNPPLISRTCTIIVINAGNLNSARVVSIPNASAGQKICTVQEQSTAQTFRSPVRMSHPIDSVQIKSNIVGQLDDSLSHEMLRKYNDAMMNMFVRPALRQFPNGCNM